MLDDKFRYNLIDVKTAMNMLIEVVIMVDLLTGTEFKPEKEDEKTEQTITGRSKYLLSDENSMNLLRCFSDIAYEFFLILSNIPITLSFQVFSLIFLNLEFKF
jgi:hypothetical protein